MAKEFTLPAYGIVPTVSASKKLPKRTEALIVPVFEGEEDLVLAASGLFTEAVELELLKTLTALGATGAAEEITKVPAPAATNLDLIVAVGLGNADEVTDTAVRRV